MSETFKKTCTVCGYQWGAGTDATHNCVLHMRLKITDLQVALNAAREELKWLAWSNIKNIEFTDNETVAVKCKTPRGASAFRKLLEAAVKT